MVVEAKAEVMMAIFQIISVLPLMKIIVDYL